MISSRSLGRFPLYIFLLSLALRLTLAWWTFSFQPNIRTEAERIAISVAAGGEYGNPYRTPTGPSAHLTPVYPLYLAAVFWIFGTGVGAEIFKAILNSAISAARCALVPLFAVDAGLDRASAKVAGILGAIYIGALGTEVSGSTNGAWLALAVLALAWATMRIWRSGAWMRRTPWIFYLGCGITALLDPVVLPMLAAFVAAGAIAAPANARRRYFAQAALLTATIVGILAPWALRNSVKIHELVWTKTNFGLEFWMSNGPQRVYDLPTNMGGPWHPGNVPDEALKVAIAGEIEYNRQKLAEAAAWVRENPGDFLMLTFQRAAAWWFPPGNIVVSAAKVFLTLLAFGGLVMIFRRRRLLGWLILCTWLSYPAVYYIIQWSTRYRVPIDWQLILCASVALWTAYGSPRKPADP